MPPVIHPEYVLQLNWLWLLSECKLPLLHEPLHSSGRSDYIMRAQSVT